MQFSSYTDFRNKVQTMLDGDDISDSDLSVAVLDLIIAAGEQRIYRELRCSSQDYGFSLTVTSNVATLPADFLELRMGPYVNTFVTASYAPPEVLNNSIQIGANTANHPVFYTFHGDAMIFYPSLATGTVVTGRYYRRYQDISLGFTYTDYLSVSTTNNLFVRHPDVFLYAALAESAPFLGDSDRLPIWEQKYTSLALAANEQERRRVSRGSKLQTRMY